MKTSNIEVTLIDYMGTDLSVVNAARVSFHKESQWDDVRGFGDDDERLSDKDAKLINYLAKHKHHSPFNHTFITFRVKAPIFVARQLVKHKFMPWNEVSRRYVDEEPEFFFPDYWRSKAENVKQGSGGALEGRDLGNGLSWDPSKELRGSVEHALECYQILLDEGVAPEQARMALPQNMMTEWYWSGTLGAYADMLRLRLDPHTQYESRIVAQKVREQLEPLFPVSLPALLEN